MHWVGEQSANARSQVSIADSVWIKLKMCTTTKLGA